MYKAALFDFDGTLADSFPLFLASLNDAAARYGFRAIRDDEVDTLRGHSSWQLMEHIDVATWQVPMITAFVRKRMAERIDMVRLFPGIHEALEDLAAHGVRLAVVSSNGQDSIRHVLGDRLASLVCDYRCDVSIFGKKPKFRQALAAMGIAPSEALAVGDEIRDLKAARSLALPFGAVLWGFTTPRALVAAGPEHVIEQVEDIVRVVVNGGA